MLVLVKYERDKQNYLCITYWISADAFVQYATSVQLCLL